MRESVILLMLASVAGCGVVPTSPESNATGVRQGVNGLEFATQLCPNETITRFSVARIDADGDRKVIWSTDPSKATGFVVVQVGKTPDGSTQDLDLHGNLEFSFDTEFSDGTQRSAAVDWELKEIPSLTADTWSADDGSEVDSDSLKAAGCSG